MQNTKVTNSFQENNDIDGIKSKRKNTYQKKKVKGKITQCS